MVVLGRWIIGTIRDFIGPEQSPDETGGLYETAHVVRSTAEKLLDSRCDAYPRLSGNRPYVKLEVDSDAVTRFLRMRGLGPRLELFNRYLVAGVNDAMGIRGTVAELDSTRNNTSVLCVYPGGRMTKNPHLEY